MDRVILTASEGMIYTDGEIFGKKIFLAENEDPSKYYEIPYTEYESVLERDTLGGLEYE